MEPQLPHNKRMIRRCPYSSNRIFLTKLLYCECSGMQCDYQVLFFVCVVMLISHWYICTYPAPTTVYIEKPGIRWCAVFGKYLSRGFLSEVLVLNWGPCTESRPYILKIQNQEGIIRNISESASLILYISAFLFNQLLFYSKGFVNM